MSDERTERRFASRKFLLACAVMVAGHFALSVKGINSAEWLDLMKWIVGLYCAGNVGATAAEALKGRQ